VSSVGDELKTVSPGSKVIGISRKDRAAILSTGRGADAAYWVDGQTGHFVSSGWYFERLPAWVEAFNAEGPADAYAGREWRPLDGGEPFAVMPAEPGPRLVGAVGSSPFSNEMLVELALAAIREEQLGRRGVTDILVVSFSANDSVGHEHGPDSAEMRDITRRTDRDVRRLLDAVDEAVGLAEALIVFTSDHGVAPVPEEQAARRMLGGRMTSQDLFGPIEAALDARFGEGTWIRGTAGSSTYLSRALIREKQLDPVRVREVAAAAAREVPHVARVFTREQLLAGEVPNEPALQRVVRSYNEIRSGDLEILLEPFWMRSGSGTTHGTPYIYDTHIPLIFAGSGIAPGRYHDHAALNDLAPTLSTMLSVEIPSGSAGRVLGEILVPAR
jgi:hypothetical protein